MIHPEGIVPDYLISAERMDDFIRWLVAQPGTQQWKCDLLDGWAYVTDFKPTESQGESVGASGVDVV